MSSAELLPLDNPFSQMCRHLGIRAGFPARSLWEADHIVPVIEGGGECGLAGLRTLCTACHLRETRALRRRLAGNMQLELPF